MITLQRLPLIITCVVAGLVYLKSYYSTPPNLEELSHITTEVRNIFPITSAADPTALPTVSLTFRGKGGVYTYPSWFPHPDLILNRIKPGDTVTVWLDDTEHRWVWQIEIEEEIIASYQEVVTAINFQKRNENSLGALMIIFGAILFWWMKPHSRSRRM